MSGLPFDGRSSVRLLRECGSNQAAYIADTVWPIMYSGDTLFLNSRGGYSLAFISGAVSLSEYLGLINHKEAERASSIQYTERPTSDIWDGRVDAERYGSLIGSISSLCRTSGEPFAHKREKGVYHAKYNGRVSDSGLISKYRPYPDNRQIGQSAQFTAKQLYRPRADSARLTGVSQDGYMLFEEHILDPGTREEANADAYESVRAESASAQAHPFGYAYGYWRTSYEDIKDLSFRKDDSQVIDVSYRYVMRYAPWIFGDETYVARFRVHIKVSVKFQPTYGTNLASEINTVPATCVSIIDTSTVGIESFSGYNGSYASVHEGWHLNTSDRVPFFTDILQPGDEFTPRVVDFLKMETRSTLRRHHLFGDLIGRRMKDIRPSSYLAASNALDVNTNVLRANNLQNLSKLGSILELLPDIKKLSQLVAKAMKGDPSALIDLIDFATEEVLKFRFAREPLSRDSKEISEADIDGALNVLTQTRTVTAQGHFNYEFPVEENFVGPGALRLETRSKVRIHFDISSLLAGYLTADSIGLLPTLARIWSLLPFSFVIDWFVNMSKRLHLVDNQLKYCTFSIFWVLYSYKVTYTYTEDELAAYGLVSVDPDIPFSISVYQREFTRWMPRLTESSFDFLRPTSSPDPLTVGSLLWQLLA